MHRSPSRTGPVRQRAQFIAENPVGPHRGEYNEKWKGAVLPAEDLERIMAISGTTIFSSY